MKIDYDSKVNIKVYVYFYHFLNDSKKTEFKNIINDTLKDHRNPDDIELDLIFHGMPYNVFDMDLMIEMNPEQLTKMIKFLMLIECYHIEELNDRIEQTMSALWNELVNIVGLQSALLHINCPPN